MEPRLASSMWSGGVLVDQERALQVDVDDPVPLGLLDQVDRPAARHAGAVHDRVQPPVPVDHVGEGVPHRRLVADVEDVVDAVGEVEGRHGGPLGGQALHAWPPRCRTPRRSPPRPFPRVDPCRVPLVVRHRCGARWPWARTYGGPSGRSRCRTEAARSGRQSVEGSGVELMLADVADQVDEEAPLGEPPVRSLAHEPVVVATGDDGLQGKRRHGLEHGEVRPARRRPRVLVDLDDQLVVTCLVRGVPSS